jgi:hypothetical protein
VLPAEAQNVANDAIYTALIAQIASFPLKRQAGSTGKAAELAFCVSGKLACRH